MSDHIGSFLNLHYHIIKAGQKPENIYLIYAMLFSLSHLTICDVVKQNKRKTLTLDIVTVELITVTNQTEWNCQAEKTEKKAKAKQLALFAKLESLDAKGSSRGNKKKEQKKTKTYRQILYVPSEETLN